MLPDGYGYHKITLHNQNVRDDYYLANGVPSSRGTATARTHSNAGAMTAGRTSLKAIVSWMWNNALRHQSEHIPTSASNAGAVDNTSTAGVANG